MSRKKPKIALLVPRYGILDRGAEVFVFELAKRISRDFDVMVYGRKKTGKDTHRSSLENINKRFKVVKVPSITEFNPVVNFFYRNLSLAKIMDKYFLSPVAFENLTFSIASFFHIITKKYDVIFPHNGIWGAIMARTVRAIRKTPFMMKSTGGIEPPVARQNPNLFVCETPVIHDWYGKHFKRMNRVLIPNGVDLDRFSPKVKPMEVKLKPPVFLCVAGLINSKRVHLAIEAVSRLKKGSLVVLGVGPLKGKLTKLGQKRLGKKRFLLTDVTQDEIPGYYTATDVFTLPSKDEPFGIVYLEAMASGLPVIATNDRQRRYIVGNAGILCDVENLDEYARALKGAVLTNFGSKPRKQAEKFSWKIIAKKYKNNFYKVIDGH